MTTHSIKAESNVQNTPITPLTPPQIYTKCAEAIVDVEALSVLQTGVLTFPTPALIPGPSVTFEPSSDLRFLYRVCGSGFFVKEGYIITCASLVTLPPYFVEDFVANSNVELTALVRDPDNVTAKINRANRIYVRLYGSPKVEPSRSAGADGCNTSHIYETVLIGVDGASNTAVLKIDPKLIFNKDKPLVEEITYLDWGKSCSSMIGSPVYNIANTEQNVLHFNSGIIRNNRNVDVRFKYYESIDTNMMFFSGSIGSALIDANGDAIGIVTGRSKNINNDQLTDHMNLDSEPLINTEHKNSNQVEPNDYGQSIVLAGDSGLRRVKGAAENINGMIFGVSERLANRISRRFIKADKGICTRRVTLQKDQPGDFFTYRKGWLNLHVELATTNTWLNHNLSLNTTQEPPSFGLRMPFSPEIRGYFVRCLNSNSPLAQILSVGDVITEIACQRLGPNGRAGSNLPGSHPALRGNDPGYARSNAGIGFYSILWKFKEGDLVRLTYYKNSENYANAHCALVRLEEIFADYPLEAITILTLFVPQTRNGFDYTPLCGTIVPGSEWYVGGGGLGSDGDLNTPPPPAGTVFTPV